MALRNADAERAKRALMVTIGNNISKYRIKAGLSQDMLAEKAGISASYVTRIESGKKSASVYVLYSISKVLQVSCDVLLADQPPTDIEQISQLFNGCSQSFIMKTERVIRTLIDEYGR